MAPTSAAIMGGMAETPQRPRMIFDCSERLRRAIKIRAAKTGLGPSELIARILESALPKELQEADESLASDEAPPSSRRGRKPKGEGE